MSLPNPGMSFTPFDPLPASDLNDMVENIEALAAGTGLNDGVITAAKIVGINKSLLTTDSNPYKFRATGNNTQALGAGSTKLQYNTETFDTNNNYDNATNYRYTAPVTGFYQVNAGARIDPASSSFCQLLVFKNGVQWLKIYSSSTAIQQNTYSGGDLMNLTAGDYIELFGYNNSGSATFFKTDNAFSAFLVSRT